VPGAPLKPMLAMTGQLPAGADWAYEFKWDGVRALADISGGRQHLYARSGVEITAAYPELATLHEQVDDALLDGEVVLLGATGQPSFTALAERMHVRDRAKAARLAAVAPVTYMIFDLLRLRGTDLTGWPYQRRRAALGDLALGGARWAVPPTFDGPATYEAAGEHGLEGVMAKGRSTGRGCARRTG
jgi:bifunctional non-homologous end joining protein LigD